MAPAQDARILEVACGTGRNLDLIDRRYPGRHLYGLDISEEMLRSAKAKLGDRAVLAIGDACGFDCDALFGAEVGARKFDRIVLSYSLSMIPDWQAAVAEGLRHLAPGGALQIVDFGDQADLPLWFGRGLRRWLATFHVTPRDELVSVLAGMDGVAYDHKYVFRRYAQYVRVTVASGECATDLARDRILP